MGYLPRLFEAYCDAAGLKPSTVGRMAGGKADVLRRATSGRITERRATRLMGWFSDHWPPRPTPSPDSPAAQALQAARDTARQHPALELSSKGQIRKPAALCALLGIDLALYYQATSQYAAGKGRADKYPRRGSDLAVLVAGLALTGDRRFASRREKVQLALAMPGQNVLRQRLAPLLEAA